MMRPSSSSVAAAVVAALVVAAMAGEAAAGEEAAAACSPTLLTPCAGPALFGGAVPAACCAQLRAQQRCLCAYARSPNYGGYIRSPNARRLFAACRLPVPTCT